MMEIFKKIISFLFPISYWVDSEYSGKVEVSFFRGKKMLNTENANYSFGSLQKVLEYGVKQVDLNTVNSILVLGMGAGSIIVSLRKKFDFRGQIIAIEKDRKIAQLAKEGFQLSEIKDLKIEVQDAYNYVQNCPDKFDFIIIDLFIDDDVPELFYSSIFWEDTLKLLTKNGKILFNAGITEEANEKIEEVIEQVEDKLKVNELIIVEYPNRLLLMEWL